MLCSNNCSMSTEFKYKENYYSEEKSNKSKVSVTNLVSRLNQEKKKREK